MPFGAPLGHTLNHMTNYTHSSGGAALTQVNAGNNTQAIAILEQVLLQDPLNLQAHNLREQQRLPGNFSDWMGVNASISPDDDIFRFFANHPTSKNPIRDYLSDGWRTMVELQDVLDVYGMSLRRCEHFLEFACGQGRFTRHLARIFTNNQLTVSDVVPGSVDFLKQAMAVNGFYSTIDPNKLTIPGRYDVIFVLSLFSHLPTPVWGAWFRVLHKALAPGGLLIFSTHGEKCARLEGVDWGNSGCKFYPSSESAVLDGHTYGSTFASPDFVTASVHDALGKSVAVNVIKSHFWGNQDAVVLSKAK